MNFADGRAVTVAVAARASELILEPQKASFLFLWGFPVRIAIGCFLICERLVRALFFCSGSATPVVTKWGGSA